MKTLFLNIKDFAFNYDLFKLNYHGLWFCIHAIIAVIHHTSSIKN